MLRRLISRVGIPRSAGHESSSPTSNLWISPSAGDELVGHSHGWSALFNKRSNDLFLSDPLSHRRINLPPIHALPDPSFNLDIHGRGSVSKVVLSSSPDDDDCRAMVSFGPANRLAFCVPGRSSKWIPLGHSFFDHNTKYPFQRYARVHDDLVYCTRRRVFTSITACHLHFPHLILYMNASDSFSTERWDWDVRDPDFPKLVAQEGLDIRKFADGPTRIWLDMNKEVLEKECVQVPHLVYAEESDQLFIVMRFVRMRMGIVPRCEFRGLMGEGETFGFIVVEIKKDKDKYGHRICTTEDDLNGMAMFVGNGSAISAAASHKFNPNSIYFTDSKRIPRLHTANDNGVFDYATKTTTIGESFKRHPFGFGLVV
ncbi:hypothetical protein OROGR_027334 [Orobanche gracilis]